MSLPVGGGATDRTVPVRMVGGTCDAAWRSNPAPGWIDAGPHSGAVDHPRHQACKWHQCSVPATPSIGRPAVRRGSLWMRSQPSGMTGPAVEALLPGAPSATGTFVMEGGAAAAPTLETAMCGRLADAAQPRLQPRSAQQQRPCKQFTVDHSPCSILQPGPAAQDIESYTPALRRPSTRACHPRAV